MLNVSINSDTLSYYKYIKYINWETSVNLFRFTHCELCSFVHVWCIFICISVSWCCMCVYIFSLSLRMDHIFGSRRLITIVTIFELDSNRHMLMVFFGCNFLSICSASMCVLCTHSIDLLFLRSMKVLQANIYWSLCAQNNWISWVTNECGLPSSYLQNSLYTLDWARVSNEF